MILKLALRTVLTHRLRFVLCTVAVVLGVAFVAGSLMFTDTLSTGLRRTFGTAADLNVTPTSALERGDRNLGTTDARPVTLSADLATRIGQIDGVAIVDPQLLVGGVQVLGRDGRPLETYGVPVFGASWPHDPGTAAFRVLDGTAPWGTAELALDRATAERAGFGVGDEVRVVTPTRAMTARLTAKVSTGLTGLAAGAPVVAFDPATAQLVLLGEPGWTSFAVKVASDNDVAEVKRAIEQLAGSGVRVRTAAQVAADEETALDQAFAGVGGVLLMFAGIALFVSAFLIVNTFAMVVAQRTRELAMLRAVGASRAQLTRTVLAEALVIGVVGSTVGLLLGAGLVALLLLAIRMIDLDLPTAGLQVSPGTVVTSYLVGVLVTVLAAYAPARRAGAVPPVAAIRDADLPERSMRVRLGIGVLMILVGASGYASALQNRGLPSALLVGLAAGIALLGVSLTSPLISRYAVWAMTVPLGRKTPVLLGRRNAQRNPRRTAATASALMIALALVSGLGVVANSVKASIDKGIADAIGTADLVITGTDGTPFSGTVAELVGKVDGVAAVGRLRTMPGRVGEHQLQVKGVDPAVLDGPIVTRVEDGRLDLAPGRAAVPSNLARTLDAKVGESLVLVTQSGTYRLTVSAVLAANRQLDAIVLSLDTFRRVGGSTTDSALYVDVAGDPSEVRQRILGTISAYPAVRVRDQQSYAEAERGPVDAILVTVYLLLALAVLIAVLGIVNTLALSVVERTREIGLLRAIGMERSQLSQMVRVESVAIAVLGALLGIALGVLFGAGIQAVMADDGIQVLDIPALQLLVSAVVAAAVGVLAALWPTRRATRLDILKAITTE